jgi:hypothetical protein
MRFGQANRTGARNIAGVPRDGPLLVLSFGTERRRLVPYRGSASRLATRLPLMAIAFLSEPAVALRGIIRPAHTWNLRFRFSEQSDFGF